MKNIKLTVSIGIPAYNEEANIGHLIHALLKQKGDNFMLKELIVISDGSTDRTGSIIKSLTDSRIKLISERKRVGQQMRQNQILKIYKGDILVLMEADTLPFDNYCINELVKPFAVNPIPDLGMVVGNAFPIIPQTFYEKVLYCGSNIKKGISTAWESGENIYSCGGHATKALSRMFTSNLKWPASVAEDAYAYLALKQLSLKMIRQHEAKIYMRNVTNISDRLKQYIKFKGGAKALEKCFPKEIIRKEYTLPTTLIIKHTLRSFISKPFFTLLYLFDFVIIRLLASRAPKYNQLYKPYMSSKKIYG